MSRSIFGWSYPPGCSSVPGDESPDPLSESIADILYDTITNESLAESIHTRIMEAFNGALHNHTVEAVNEFHEALHTSRINEAQSSHDNAQLLSILSSLPFQWEADAQAHEAAAEEARGLAEGYGEDDMHRIQANTYRTCAAAIRRAVAQISREDAAASQFAARGRPNPRDDSDYYNDD